MMLPWVRQIVNQVELTYLEMQENPPTPNIMNRTTLSLLLRLMLLSVLIGSRSIHISMRILTTATTASHSSVARDGKGKHISLTVEVNHCIDALLLDIAAEIPISCYRQTLQCGCDLSGDVECNQKKNGGP